MAPCPTQKRLTSRLWGQTLRLGSQAVGLARIKAAVRTQPAPNFAHRVGSFLSGGELSIEAHVANFEAILTRMFPAFPSAAAIYGALGRSCDVLGYLSARKVSKCSEHGEYGEHGEHGECGECGECGEYVQQEPA